MPSKKRKTVYKGYLKADDISKIEKDEVLERYWNKVKNNLFVLVEPNEEKVIFMNNEFKKVSKKYEGYKIKITIEAIDEEEDEGLPDPDEQYEGAEKVGRQLMSIFKIQ